MDDGQRVITTAHLELCSDELKQVRLSHGRRAIGVGVTEVSP